MRHSKTVAAKLTTPSKCRTTVVFDRYTWLLSLAACTMVCSCAARDMSWRALRGFETASDSCAAAMLAFCRILQHFPSPLCSTSLAQAAEHRSSAVLYIYELRCWSLLAVISTVLGQFGRSASNGRSDRSHVMGDRRQALGSS